MPDFASRVAQVARARGENPHEHHRFYVKGCDQCTPVELAGQIAEEVTAETDRRLYEAAVVGTSVEVTGSEVTPEGLIVSGTLPQEATETYAVRLDRQALERAIKAATSENASADNIDYVKSEPRGLTRGKILAKQDVPPPRVFRVSVELGGAEDNPARTYAMPNRRERRRRARRA